jgi:cell division protein FtsW (lipid II flippase)
MAVAVRPWEDEQNSGIARGVLALFAFVSLGLLGGTLASYLGVGAGGSPRIPARSLVRVQQTGLYVRVSDSGEPSVTFSGEPIRTDAIERNGFQIPALGDGQRVRLTAVRDGNAIKAWRVESPAMDTPIRLDGRCVNAVPGGPVTEKDKYTIAISTAKNGPRRLMSFTFEPRGRTVRIRYSEGDRSAGPIDHVLTEGARLTTLLEAGNLRARWSAHDAPLALQAGEDVEPWSVLNRISLVRIRRGDAGSQIGVLVDPAVVASGVQILRNGQPIQLIQAFPPVELPVAGDATLAFGLTGTRRFALRLPGSISSAGGTPRLEVAYESPISYALPPETGRNHPFLITSGHDMVPLDGYVFQTGNDNHPFYAKASISEPYRSARIQDGVSRKGFAPDEPIFLGDDDQGVVARFHVQQPSVEHAGLWALGSLGLLAVVFAVQLWWRPRAIGRADVAWAFLWVGTITVLTVRLLLAYRCSLLPPDDATAPELASFHKALRVSLPALLLIPAAMALVRLRYVSLAQRRRRDASPTPSLPYDRLALYFPAAATVAPILARILGTRDDLFGFRTSVWSHLLLVGGLAAFAFAADQRKEFAPNRDKPAWKAFSIWDRHGFLVFVLLNLSAFLMLVVAIGDNGALIYGVSISLAVLAGGLPFRVMQAQRKLQGVPAGLVIALAATVLAAFAVGLNTRFFVQRFLTAHGTIAYRIASLGDMDPEMLLNPARTDYVEATEYRQNRDQQWQMLLYPAVGASEHNPGYGGAPLSKVALKYPTSMTDTTYSVYLLGEFGPWAGAFTVALYLVFMAACFAGATAVRRDGSWRFVPLLGIGAFFAANGLYMAAADIGVVPFTGQNLPLLSLYSVADVAQCLAVLVLASLLLRRQGRATVIPPNTGRWLAPAFAAGATAAWLGVAWAGISMPASFGSDMDEPEVLRQVVRRVDSRQIALNDDLRIDPRSVSDLAPIEKEAIQEFNLRPDKEDPEAGLYYIEPAGGGNYQLQVNRAYFHLTSPYRRGDGVPWRGSIFAHNSEPSAPRLYMLSSPLSLSLSSGGYPAIAFLDSTRPVRGASAAILAARSPLGRIDFGEYRRRKVGGRTVVTLKAKLPQTMPKGRGWSVYVEGQPVPDAGTELQPDDLISIEDRTRKSPRRYNLIYLGAQPEPLAFVRWRNGSYRRVLPGGASFGMVANIGRTADDVRPRHDLALTLDLDLHQRLQSAIRAWCMAQPRSDLGWQRNDPETTKPVSMALIDTFRGDVLALPSFPHVDPTSEEVASDLGRGGPGRRAKVFRNWNFENHVIGSTIKPLTFSTMSVQLRPTYHLEDAVVHARELTHDNLGGIPLVGETAPYPPVGDITMSEFLTQSRTWPACIVGGLGLVESLDSLKSALVPDAGREDITLGGKAYRLDLLRPSDRIVTHDPRNDRWTPRTNLSDTLLFQGLSDLYNVQIPPNRTTEAEAVHRRIESFLPSLDWADNQPMPTYATEVVPRRVLYECDSMRSVKQELLTTLIGGAESLWNNVAMAEAFARLCTGRRVNARLEEGPKLAFGAMPAPLNDPVWRERALLKPLEQVHITGTARSITVNFDGYRAVMKTGTLGETVDSESLMFTVGRFQNGGFVPGETVTGYFFMRDTNLGGHMLKFSLADRVLPIVVDYLRTRPRSKVLKQRP